MNAEDRGRPPISVVVPFYGGEREAATALTSLAQLQLRPDDELIVGDNTRGSAVLRGAAGGVSVVAAGERRSAYSARNAAASGARGAWLLFLDSDCRPRPSLLDDYFAEAVSDRCGGLAGTVRPAPDQRGVVVRYSESRGHFRVADHFRHPYRPFGITGNLLIRKRAWDELGGFAECIRSGGDVDFCWRLQAAGWELGYRPQAVVEHPHPRSLQDLVRQAHRHGGGHAWLERRHPGSQPPPPLRRLLVRCGGGLGRSVLRRDWDEAVFKLLDAAVFTAQSAGYRTSNECAHGPGDRGRTESLARDAVPAEGGTADAHVSTRVP